MSSRTEIANANNARYLAEIHQLQAQNQQVNMQHQQENKASNQVTAAPRPQPAPKPSGAIGHNVNTFA